MKRVLLVIIILILTATAAAAGWYLRGRGDYNIAPTITKVIPRPLDKYTIENLENAVIQPGLFEKQNLIIDQGDFVSNIFSLRFNPEIKGVKLKKTTGQVNVPKSAGKYPLVLMLRGYVDQEIYRTGDGTRKAAEVFSKNGFITIAPDFLGYAGSSIESGNIFESRFQTYVSTLALLKSLNEKSFNQLVDDKWDEKNVFLWGHSNGGQIAITTLEITGLPYPTTLWAPVTKPFPYSILYYTDEAEDRGKLIRRELAKFEDLYNTDLYAIDQYFEKINVIIQIHQGTSDDAVPISWSNDFVNSLDKLNKDITYFQYAGADHNMKPAWNTVVNRDIEFFNQNLKD